MPLKYLMSWEGPPKNRWVKMYKGVRYRVSCDELGAMMCTQEGSAKLANKWWEKKKAEIDGPSPLGQVLNAVEEIPIEKLREMMMRGDVVRQILTELPVVKAQIAKEEIEMIVGEPLESDTQAIEKLGQMVSKVAETAPSPNASFRHHAERFLALTHGECEAMSYREIYDFITSLYGAAGMTAEMDVKELNEAIVDTVFLWLKESSLTPPTKKKRWGFFKRLVRYCWETKAIELPRRFWTSMSGPRSVMRRLTKGRREPEISGYLHGQTDELEIGYLSIVILSIDEIQLMAGAPDHRGERGRHYSALKR